ncbi:MAG TPA: hypothetical protein VK425_11450 [Acidimicrobiales bacterium]|nr:hypothetical protein [Acidimicrobiales bacterium]
MAVHLSIDYHRQKFVASYVLPARLGRGLRQRCPDGASLAPAKQALRQWLRLHILAPEELEMPSLAVSLLWREFTSSPDFEHFSAHAYGHLSNRKPDKAVLGRRPDFTNTSGLALTFAMACIDQGLDTPHPAALPMLFEADGALGIDGGQRWALNCGAVNCRVVEATRCAYHELGPAVPSDLPKEIRFDVPAPFPLDGSSHQLFGPLY